MPFTTYTELKAAVAGNAHRTDLSDAQLSDFVALAALVKAEIKAVRDSLSSLVSTFNSHTHIVPTGGISVEGSPAAQTTVAPTTIPATLSTATGPAAVGDVNSNSVKVRG